jgi:glycosyltransferase involved in cell wall biosynthesis
MAKGNSSKPLVAFMYLGRRGALGRFTLQLAQAAADFDDYDFEFVISSHGEIADELKKLGLPVTTIDTFDRATPYNLTTRFFAARRALVERFSNRPPAAAVTLMPHVWSPMLAPPIRKLGTKYLTVIHDAVPHPGDSTAWMTRWLTSDAKQADLVITLSRAVAERIIGKRLAEPGRVLPLFHPDLVFGDNPADRKLPGDRALRILFFGRIMAYKGLPLLVDAVELLQQRGLPIQLGVAGSGELGPESERLENLGADVMNHWIGDNEIGGILARYDAMACSHIEASQSGVACAAFGDAMPVIAMPVGGIAEQVIDSKTGVLARRITSQAFAEATQRLAMVPGLYEGISRHLKETSGERSTDRFLREVVTEIETLRTTDDDR